MVIESGVIIFLGLILLAWKLPLHWKLVGLGYPLYVDLGASICAYILHWGTFTGVMAAAVAGLMTSAFTSIMRLFMGYTYYNNGWWYKPGMKNYYSSK